MRLLKLEATNFIGWKDLSIDFSSYSGIIGITADDGTETGHSNGMGKSSILQAVVFAIYGDTRDKTIDEMIYNGDPSGMTIALDFEFNSNKYHISRKKKPGSPQKCSIYIINDDGKKELMGSDIEKLLNLPGFNIYSNTVLSKQGDLSGFIVKTPSEQKDILQEMFALDKFLDYEKKVREIVNSKDKSLIETKAKMEMVETGTRALLDEYASIDSKIKEFGNLEETIKDLESSKSTLESESKSIADSVSKIKEDSVKVSALQSQVDMIGDNVKKKLARIEENKNTISSTIRNIKLYEDKIKSLQQEHDEIKNIVIDSVVSDTDKIRKEITILEDKINKAKGDIVKVKCEIGFLDEQSGKISGLGGKCPTCNNDITQEFRNKHLKEIESQIIPLKESEKTLQAQVETLGKDLSDLTAKEKELVSIVTQQEQKIKSKKILSNNISEYKTIIKTFGDSIYTCNINNESITKEIKDDLSKIASINSDIGKISFSEDDLKAIQSKYDTLNESIKSIEKDIKSKRVELETLMTLNGKKGLLVSKMAQEKESLEKIGKNMLQCKGDLEIAKDTLRAFGPFGIPSLVIENKLIDLQAYIDRYMDKLSDGKISVKISTTKVSSTGKISDTIQFMVDDGNTVRNITSYSGGEKVRVFLAIRLALAKMLSFKSDVLKGVFIVDELNELDDAGLDSFIELLRMISSEYNQILLISHIGRLKSACDTNINIVPEVKGVLHA